MPSHRNLAVTVRLSEGIQKCIRIKEIEKKKENLTSAS